MNVVWLVEDNKLHAQMIEQTLGAEATLRTFRNGASLLEYVSQKPELCDVVILDLNLPDLSGNDVCRFLRSAYDELTLPVLLLTGEGNKRDLLEGLNAGANDFLTKPFDAAELRARVRTLIRVKTLNQERKRAEMDRERYRELMVGMIGHDLRTPLSAISTGTDAMMIIEGTSEAHNRVLGRMKSSIGRMSRMIEQIVDFTRTRFGGIQLKKQTTELSAVVRQCVEEMQLAAPDCDVRATIQDDCHALWDPDALSQVVGNLLSNAYTHGAKESPVELLARCEEGVAFIEVRNQGTAIPPELHESIFDPFRQGERRSSHKGLGLGLYIARVMVEAHGGTITMQSSTDEGTCFRVRLPR